MTALAVRSGKRGFTGAALVATSAYVALHWLGRTYGSTREERAAALPGDNVVAIVPADFVMSRDMLHGVKRRAECAA